jgi:PAS domain-containing protein
VVGVLGVCQLVIWLKFTKSIKVKLMGILFGAIGFNMLASYLVAKAGFTLLVMAIAILIGIASIWATYVFIARLLIKPINQMHDVVNGIMEEKLMVNDAAKDKSIGSKLINNENEITELSNKIQQLVDLLKEKLFWYENILDSIPFPLSITDMNMNWTFINKPVEGMLGIKRQDVVGHACNEWNANICNTENCGIARFTKELSPYLF